MFHFNKYQKYFLFMQKKKKKNQNFKLRVDKFWGNILL